MRLKTTLAAALVLAVCISAQATEIPNGNFSDTSEGTNWTSSIADWTLDPSVTVSSERAGLFFAIDGFSNRDLDPDDRTAFALIDNSGGGDQTLRSSTFRISNFRIVFVYAYLTNNEPGDTTNTDPFTVTLVDTTNASGTVTKTVSDVDDSHLAKSTMSYGPFAGIQTYDTDWRTFTIDTSSLIGDYGYLEFTIADSDEESGDASGFILDNVTQVPEPATLFLFGLGGLGLTLYGRRKLRKKLGYGPIA